MFPATAPSCFKNEVRAVMLYPPGTSRVMRLVPRFDTRTSCNSRTTTARSSAASRVDVTDESRDNMVVVGRRKVEAKG